MTDNRNLILAIVLSVLIMVGFQYIFDLMYPKPEKPAEATRTEAPATPGAAPGEPGVTGIEPPAPASPVPAPAVGDAAAVPSIESRQKAIGAAPRVKIDTPRLHGSISLIGGKLDDVTLANYHETLDRTSPEIVIFSPVPSGQGYLAQLGWVGSGLELPGADTRWTADRLALTPDEPVTLSWTNSAGITFRRVFSVDKNFMFTVTDSFENTSEETLTVNPYGLISRHGTPPVSGFFILHEGPLGVFNETLREVDYDDLQGAGTITEKSTGGWIGVTDKYWLAALIPNAKEQVGARFLHEKIGTGDRYQVDFVGQTITVPPGEMARSERRIFVGAKEVRLLDAYRDQYQIQRFDRAIDFGWFYFLTKPLFYFLIFIKELVGNLGVAILILTVTIKALFFPLANKSYRAMSQMRKLQPEVMKLKERFGDDRVRFNQEMMALYKREKVNPASGCLPVIIQIPVFFALYKVLFVTIEMRHAHFFLWIRDLSAPDPTSVWNLFGLIPWEPATVLPAAINIGAWPLIMGVTMYLQQKLNPQPPDPLQAKIFMLLPVMFTFFLAQFPAGLVIYWAWNNILSILQQWVIMRRMGVKP